MCASYSLRFFETKNACYEPVQGIGQVPILVRRVIRRFLRTEKKGWALPHPQRDFCEATPLGSADEARGWMVYSVSVRRQAPEGLLRHLEQASF